MRVSQSQRQRTHKDPLVVGTFSELSFRTLKGTLGPKNQVIGSADTRYTSNGGFGGGTYNHWFQFNILSPGWIIITKGGPRPQYIQVSAYDLNLIPIQERAIFDEDNVVTDLNGVKTYPYTGTVMGASSDLYNNFEPNRFDKSNNAYFPLETGSYLLCISTTRNELLDYEVAVTIEFPTQISDILFEDYSLILYEDLIESHVIADLNEE